MAPTSIVLAKIELAPLPSVNVWRLGPPAEEPIVTVPAVMALVAAIVKVVGPTTVAEVFTPPSRKLPVPRFAVNDASCEKSTATGLSLLPPAAAPSEKVAGAPATTSAPPPSPTSRVTAPLVLTPTAALPLIVSVRPAAMESTLSAATLV